VPREEKCSPDRRRRLKSTLLNNGFSQGSVSRPQHLSIQLWKGLAKKGNIWKSSDGGLDQITLERNLREEKVKKKLS